LEGSFTARRQLHKSGSVSPERLQKVFQDSSQAGHCDHHEYGRFADRPGHPSSGHDATPASGVAGGSQSRAGSQGDGGVALMRIQLEGPKEVETPASLVAIDTYRQQLGVQKA
jgi:hypothetical protein